MADGCVQGGLVLLLGRDVADDADATNGLLAVGHHAALELQPAPLPVMAAGPEVEGERDVAHLAILLERAAERVEVVGMDARAPVAPGACELARLRAEQRLDRRRELQPVGREVPVEDPEMGGRDGEARAVLAALGRRRRRRGGRGVRRPQRSRGPRGRSAGRRRRTRGGEAEGEQRRGEQGRCEQDQRRAAAGLKVLQPDRGAGEQRQDRGRREIARRRLSFERADEHDDDRPQEPEPDRGLGRGGAEGRVERGGQARRRNRPRGVARRRAGRAAAARQAQRGRDGRRGRGDGERERSLGQGGVGDPARDLERPQESRRREEREEREPQRERGPADGTFAAHHREARQIGREGERQSEDEALRADQRARRLRGRDLVPEFDGEARRGLGESQRDRHRLAGGQVDADARAHAGLDDLRHRAGAGGDDGEETRRAEARLAEPAPERADVDR